MADGRPAKRRRVSPDGNNSLPGFAKINLEEDYERRLRKNRQNQKAERLPIKRGGRPENNPLDRDVLDGTAEVHLQFEHDREDDGVVTEEQQFEEPSRPRLSPKEEIRQAKEELARVAGLIGESPEEHIALLKTLAQLTSSDNVTVRKLALGTQLAVYKDIIPGYRIRLLQGDDAKTAVSKEVRKLRGFEQSLLAGYREYVQTLARLSKSGEASDGMMVAIATSCTCALLSSVPHFNLRNDLIAILVRKLSTRSMDGDYTKCRECLEQIFREDEDGRASLEAVGQLTKVMKAKEYNVHEGVLNTFLHLRLLSEFAHKASTNRVDKDESQGGKPMKKTNQKREFRTKRERKVQRERKEVEKEMKEADAAVSYEERDKNQAETLKLVFVAYFRILKSRKQHLMGAVLEGLAKYAHLINQDFFGDVLEALKDLISDASAPVEGEEADDSGYDRLEERNTIRESLLCIITAFALLQGQQDVAKSANSLHLDLNFFITHLYRTLLPLTMDQNIELSAKTGHLPDPNGLSVPAAKDNKINVATTTVLLLRSLQGVLLPPTSTKMVPPVRIAAFTKQLLTAALHLPQKSTIAVLGLLTQVSKVHGNKIAALWNTEERKGDGVFDALGDEVDSSNPFAATVWEGEMLRHHFDPRVRDAVKAVEKNVLDAR